MSSKIEQVFKRTKQEKRCAFIPFITGGFPNTETFIGLLRALDTSGADIIEVGIPFSDPLADGPIIQHSSKLALDAGVTPQSILDTLREIKHEIRAPLVVMSYWNPIMRRGPEEFAAALSEAGVSGAIVPDLTPEESDKWRIHAENHGIDTIFMVAPITPAERIMKIASFSRGFLYLVSMTGVTGSSLNVSSRLEFQITNVKGMTNLPVSVGFGVSTPSQASELAKYADGVIVGSALVKRCIESQSDVEAINSVSSLSREISEALRFRN